MPSVLQDPAGRKSDCTTLVRVPDLDSWLAGWFVSYRKAYFE